jgi:ATP-dependent DNA helicase PIF1
MTENLSIEQNIAYQKFITGDNVFITGPAGTGKSRLIKDIVEYSLKYNKNIQVCSTTGCSTDVLRQIGIRKAYTIHSFSGLGYNELPLPLLIRKIKKSKYYRNNWTDVEILIIDEVSMVSKQMFEYLDSIARAVRRDDRPFGGIQVIFTGDFYQLPPVGKKEYPDSNKFCFESPIFHDIFQIENCVLLKRIFRQTDITYKKMLNQVRIGKITRSTIKKLEERVCTFTPKDEHDVWPTRFVPLSYTANKINKEHMKKLDAPDNPVRIFEMTETRNPDIKKKDNDFELAYLHRNVNALNKLKLCIGTQVMHLVNIKDPKNPNKLDLFNGTQGVVIGFDGSGYPIVRFLRKLENGEFEYFVRIVAPHTWKSEKHINVSVSQIPLIMAWALTIHKAQGLEFLRIIIDIGSDIFACGQTYVALSRCKSWDGLYISDLDITKIRISTPVRIFYDKIEEYRKIKEQWKNKYTHNINEPH